MSDKRATLVGLDRYSGQNQLLGCCKDAKDLANVLARHEVSNRRNFHCDLITDSDGQPVDADRLRREIKELFSGPAACVLFYYAGHAVVDSTSAKGRFVVPGRDGRVEQVPFDDLFEEANKAYSRNILSTVIVLDCCGSGAFADVSNLDETQRVSLLGNGVTILAASGRTERASEHAVTGGMFTQYMVEGLKGSAADLRGWVSAASIYSHIDHMLGRKGQRPVYKASVSEFVTLRECTPKIEIETLLALPKLFERPDAQIELDPSFEPDRENVPERYRHIPQDPHNVATFKRLQSLNRQGLVVPIGAEHMYYAAIESKSCGLTELGKHYRELAALDRL